MLQLFRHSRAYNWQATPEETKFTFPCDDYIPEPDDLLFRAVTIRARAERVFDWLCQLRVAPYSYDWIDNGGRLSPRTLDPALGNLRAGQTFMEIFTLVTFQQDEHITLLTKNNLFGTIAGSYLIRRVSDSEVRLLVKLRVQRSRNAVLGLLGPILPWGDWIMMRKQLLTIKELAESSP